MINNIILSKNAVLTALRLFEDIELNDVGEKCKLPLSYYEEKEVILQHRIIRYEDLNKLILDYRMSRYTCFSRLVKQKKVNSLQMHHTKNYTKIVFNDFSSDTVSRICSHLYSIKKTNKLIFDIRHNVGGGVDACALLLDMLICKDTQLFDLYYANKCVSYFSTDGIKFLFDTLEVITSQKTISTAEIFSNCISTRCKDKLSIPMNDTFGKKTGQSNYRIEGLYGIEFRINSFLWNIPTA